MAIKDFQAKRIRSSVLITSGGIHHDYPNLGMMVYSSSVASNFEGGISAGGQSSVPGMLTDVGPDVYLFVSGSATKTGGADLRDKVTLFGGDMVVSGTLWAERMIVEVDTIADGDMWITGSLIIKNDVDSDAFEIQDSLGNQIFHFNARNEKFGIATYRANSYDSTEGEWPSLYVAGGGGPTANANHAVIIDQDTDETSALKIRTHSAIESITNDHTKLIVGVDGKLGLWGETGLPGLPVVRLHIMDTAEQLRLAYGPPLGGNFTQFIVGSAGALSVATNEQNVAGAASITLNAAGHIYLNSKRSSVAKIMLQHNDSTRITTQLDHSGGPSIYPSSGLDFIFKDSNAVAEVFRVDGDASALVMATGKKLSFGSVGLTTTGSIHGDNTHLYLSSSNAVMILSGAASAGDSPDESDYPDTNFFVSGAIGSKNSLTDRGTSVFGGDMMVSGTMYTGGLAVTNNLLQLSASMVDIGWDPDDDTVTYGPTLRLSSHATSVASSGLGAIEFWGNSAGTSGVGAKIFSSTDASAWNGGTDTPANLEFWTTPDSQDVNEDDIEPGNARRMVITADGRVGIGHFPSLITDLESAAILHISGSGGDDVRAMTILEGNYSDAESSPCWSFWRGRPNGATTGNVQGGDVLGAMEYSGYYGGSWREVGKTRVVVDQAGGGPAAQIGGRFEWWTKEYGVDDKGGELHEMTRMILDGTGSLAVIPGERASSRTHAAQAKFHLIVTESDPTQPAVQFDRHISPGLTSSIAQFHDGMILFMSGGSSVDGADGHASGSKDTNFFVSGTIGSKDSLTDRGTSVFGGDLVTSGTLFPANGVSLETGEWIFFNSKTAVDGDQVTIHAPTATSLEIEAQDYFTVKADNIFWSYAPTLWHNANHDSGGRLIFEGRHADSMLIRADVMGGAPGDERVYLLSGTVSSGDDRDEWAYKDTNFFVSGTIGSRGTDIRGTSGFGGDISVSGSLYFNDDQHIGPIVGVGTTQLAIESHDILHIYADQNINVYSPNTWFNVQGISGFLSHQGATDAAAYNIHSYTSDNAAVPSRVYILSGTDSSGDDDNEWLFTDTNFFVSGTIGSKDSLTDRGTSVFGGDLHISGNLTVEGDAPSSAFVDDGSVVRLSTISDYVGIGTAGPGDKLHVSGALGGSAYIRVSGYDTAGLKIDSSKDSALSRSHIQFMRNGSTKATIDFRSGSTARIRRGVGAEMVEDGAVLLFSPSGQSDADIAFGLVQAGGSYSAYDFPLLISASSDVNGIPQVLFMSGSGGAGHDPLDPKNFVDTNFFVSGAIGSKDSQTDKGTAVFGGDVVVSGSIYSLSEESIYIGTGASQVKITAAGGSRMNLGDGSNQVLILSGGAADSENESAYLDTNFFVSGTIGSKNSQTDKGTSVFGGDLHISGNLTIDGSGGGGSTIGAAEDGSYTDGLFTDFATDTTIGTAIDRINEVLKGLAPSAAPSLDDITCVDNGSGAKLSFGAASGITGYADALSSGLTANNLSNVDINGTFSSTSASNDLRRACFAGATVINGTLNDDVSADSPNYAAGALGNGDQGTLRIYANHNSTMKHSVDLSSFGSGNSFNGNGTGFTLSAVTDGHFADGSAFPTFKHRTGTWTVAVADQVAGWNYVRVEHVIGGTTTTTNYVEWVNDATGAGVAITVSGHTLDTLSMTGTKNLSGVKYHTGGTAAYDVTIANAYRNVYSTSQITFGGSNTSVSPVNIPDINYGGGEDETKSIVLTNLTVNISGDPILNGSISVNTNVPHPLKSNISGGGNQSISGILLYDLSDTSSTTSETFRGESYRLVAGSYANQAAVTSGGNAWVSTTSLAGVDGLLFYNSRLYAPVQGAASGDFSSITNGPGSNVDYSGITSGTRTFYRKFQNTSGGSKTGFNLTINGHASSSIASHGTAFSTTNLKVYVKLPETGGGMATGFMDPAVAFSTGQVSDGDGCLVGSFDSTLNATNEVTFGTQSVADDEWVVVIIKADATYTGYLSAMSVSWS